MATENNGLLSMDPKNYATIGEQILKSISKRAGIKVGKNVKFDKMTGVYRSAVYGYVVYDGMNSVSVIPVINVSEKWRGIMVLPPQKNVKKQLGLDDINSMISELPIQLMVNYDRITELVEENLKFNEGVCCVFVEGKKPIDGNVQKVILDYDMSIETGKKSEDGSIDFKDIYDEVMEANYDDDPCYKIGNNLKVEADGINIKSAIKGILVNNNNTISVSNVIEIEKVDLSTGNIEVDGSVIIKENVTPGFSIKTEGDIKVNGNIEDAKINCVGRNNRRTR